MGTEKTKQKAKRKQEQREAKEESRKDSLEDCGPEKRLLAQDFNRISQR